MTAPPPLLFQGACFFPSLMVPHFWSKTANFQIEKNAVAHVPKATHSPFPDAYGHTTGNTPEPVRFQKLSLVRPS